MKFLDREGDGPRRSIPTRPPGCEYLDDTSPRYIGGILEMLNARLFKFWHDLPEGAAHRQAAERDQARPERRCSRSSTATRRGSSSSWAR